MTSSTALFGARPAELLDVESRMVRLRRRHSGQRRVDAFAGLGRVARDLEVDDRRVAVLGDLPARSSGERMFSTYATLDRRPVTSSTAAAELRVADRQAVALDEDDLLDRPHAGAVERLLGLVRLAGEVVDLRDLLRTDRVADREREDDEREPPEDRLLAVPPAPVRHAGRHVDVMLRTTCGTCSAPGPAFGVDRSIDDQPAEGRSRSGAVVL